MRKVARDTPDPHERLARQLSRRELLYRSGLGLGAVGLSGLLAQAFAETPPEARAGGPGAAGPLAPRAPHFPARAKHVIHFFLNGGPSHVDTFDPKPLLARYAGKALPSPNLRTERKTGAAFPSPFRFERRGVSGIEVSEIFPRVGDSIDEIAVLRGMETQVPNHEPSLMLMNCGNAVMSRPSFGAWLTYGLGTENQNLPGFIAMCPGGYPIKDAENWRCGFLPGIYQGTFVDSRHEDVERLIENIRSPHATAADQKDQLDLLGRLNAIHGGGRLEDPRLEARLQSFELAFRMQVEAADAFDITKEPASMRALYGADLPPGEGGIHGRQALIARRLIERGVRVVQLWHGAGQPWDNHDNIEKEHRKLAAQCDRGIGALLVDLKARGLLDETLVIWGGEFGRTPVVELRGDGKPSTGRDHNPYGFTVWLAGGGVRGGTVHGATDEFGFRAIGQGIQVHDLHATILHLLGFDHERFTYRYAGRDFRLTDVHGRVLHDVLA